MTPSTPPGPSPFGPIHPVTGAADDYDGILELVGLARRADRRGLARHARVLPRAGPGSPSGSSTSYGFTAVAVEADWPDAYRVNRYVLGQSGDPDGRAALGGLRAVPGVDVAQPRRPRLRRVAAGPQRRPSPSGEPGPLLRSRPLQPASLDGRGDRATSTRSTRPRPAGPGSATPASTTSAATDRRTATPLAYEAALPCENEVVEQLVELRRRADALPPPRRLGRRGRAVLRPAERSGRPRRRGVLPADVPRPGRRRGTCATGTWPNTLDALLDHLDGQLGHAKVVVWAHNSHVGDARATEMGDRGELNVGQLVAPAVRGPTPL